MMRDELLTRIAALPPDTDVGIKFGQDHLDVDDLVLWGDGSFAALVCHSADLRDVLAQREFPCGRPGPNVSGGQKLEDENKSAGAVTRS